MAALSEAKWIEYCHMTPGANDQLTSSSLTKAFKSNHIYSKKLTTTDTDIAFSKFAAKNKDKKKITYEQFHELVAHLAETKKVGSVEEVLEALEQGEINLGKVTGQSVTGNVDRMTDKSLYTGVHQHGGPSTVDRDKVSLQAMVSDHDCLTQDVRGVRIGDKHHGKYEDKADYGAVSKSSKAHESSLRSGGSTGKGDMKF